MITYFPPSKKEEEKEIPKFYQDIEKVDTRAMVKLEASGSGVNSPSSPDIANMQFLFKQGAKVKTFDIDSLDNFANMLKDNVKDLLDVKFTFDGAGNYAIDFIGIDDIVLKDDDANGGEFTPDTFEEDTVDVLLLTKAVTPATTKTVNIPSGASHVSIHGYGEANGIEITDDVSGESNEPDTIEDGEIFNLPMLDNGQYNAYTVTVPANNRIKIHGVSKNSDFDITQA